MTTDRRLTASRLASVLAIASAFSLLVFGWWMLAVALGFGLAAGLFMPRPERHGAPRRLRRVTNAVYMRLHPHAWRPRPR